MPSYPERGWESTSAQKRSWQVPGTHDRRCICDCVGRASLVAVAREAQSVASLTADYFGGYIGKAHFVGKTERRRCEEGMIQLAGQHEADPAAVHVRACARRPIADLEAKCTVRSIVEICVLRSRHDPSDHLAAECISTFRRVSFPAHRFLHVVLQAEQQPQEGRSISRVIQTRQRTKEARLQVPTVKFMDIAGKLRRGIIFPPMSSLRIRHPFEIRAPNASGESCFSAWTPEGEFNMQSCRAECMVARPKPFIVFIDVEPGTMRLITLFQTRNHCGGSDISGSSRVWRGRWRLFSASSSCRAPNGFRTKTDVCKMYI